MEKEISLNVDTSGRLAIPLKLRKQLNVPNGGQVLARFEKGEIHLRSRQKALEEAQQIVAKYCTSKDLVQELFDMRKEELKKEKHKFSLKD